MQERGKVAAVKKNRMRTSLSNTFNAIIKRSTHLKGWLQYVFPKEYDQNVLKKASDRPNKSAILLRDVWTRYKLLLQRA